MRNRDRINFRPTPGPVLQAIGPPKVLPDSARIVGVIDRDPDGEMWLAHLRSTGALVAISTSGSVQALPERKVLAAIAAHGLTLEELPVEDAMAPANARRVGSLLRAWQDKAELTDHAAADLLGLSERTFQRWRDDGGCPYPKLVLMALRAIQ